MRIVKVSSDTQVSTTPITILGYQIAVDGTNAGTCKIYDEATSSKTAAKLRVDALTPGTVSKEVFFPEPCPLGVGCYVDIGGTNSVTYLYVK